MRIDDPFPWKRIAKTLEATPIIINYLLNGVAKREIDYRPEDERLTIREITVHLTHWDKIILKGMRRIINENNPYLELETDHLDYGACSSADIVDSLTAFAVSRSAVVELLSKVNASDWERPANRSVYGPTTLDAQALMLIMHDTYHVQQITQWRTRYILSGSE